MAVSLARPLATPPAGIHPDQHDLEPILGALRLLGRHVAAGHPDPTKNYWYRESGTRLLLSQLAVPSIRRTPGENGADAVADGYAEIELKSCGIGRLRHLSWGMLKATWDTRPGLSRAMAPDGYGFSLHRPYEAYPWILLWLGRGGSGPAVVKRLLRDRWSEAATGLRPQFSLAWADILAACAPGDAAIWAKRPDAPRTGGLAAAHYARLSADRLADLVRAGVPVHEGWDTWTAEPPED